MIDNAQDIERLLERARPLPMAVDADLAQETGRRRVRSRRMTIASAALALVVAGSTAAVQLGGDADGHTTTPAHSTNSAPAPLYSAVPGSIFQRGVSTRKLPYDEVTLLGGGRATYQVDGTLQRLSVKAVRDGRKVPLHVAGPLAGGLLTARDGLRQLIIFAVPANASAVYLLPGGDQVVTGVPLASGGQVAITAEPAPADLTGAWWLTTTGGAGATRGVVATVRDGNLTAFVLPGLHVWGLRTETDSYTKSPLTSVIDTGNGDGSGLPRVYARLLPAAATSIKVGTNASVRDARVTVEKVAGTSYQLVLVTSPTARFETKLVTDVTWVDADGRSQHVRG